MEGYYWKVRQTRVCGGAGKIFGKAIEKSDPLSTAFF